MDLSGIIFVVLALAWAVYLIPKALKHHDEVARTRSIDRFSTAMRVLARREPVNRRDARLVVTPPRPSKKISVATAESPASVESAASKASTGGSVASESARRTAGRSDARRKAARAAARRRRRILLFLILVDLVVVGLAAFALVAWWSVAIPATLTVLYLFLCRRQVRRANDALWSQSEQPAAESPGGVDTEVDAEVAPRRAIRVDSAYGSSRNDQGFEEISPDEDTVTISAVAVKAALGAGSVGDADAAAAAAVEMDTVAVAVPTADGGSLWDPLPVTLPTYVNKPRAARTVRTIDLSQPGTWSSGRSEEDSKLVEQARAEEDAAVEAETQRAVGS